MALSVTPNEAVTFGVRYADEFLMVVEKPARLVTQPGKGHDTDTLLNGLFAAHGPKLQNLGAARDFGLLHRLDKMTSGLLVVALRGRAYDALRADFEERRVGKFYWAVCMKAPSQPSGLIRRPIVETEPRAGARGETRSARVSPAGKPAATAFRLLASSPAAALIEARPLTGRLHQVRVHLDSLGCTVLGDDFYGSKAAFKAAPRLALHAHRLTFTHPETGQTIDVKSAFPKDLRPLLRRLALPRPDLQEQRAEQEAEDRDAAAEIAESAVVAEQAAGGETVDSAPPEDIASVTDVAAAILSEAPKAGAKTKVRTRAEAGAAPKRKVKANKRPGR